MNVKPALLSRESDTSDFYVEKRTIHVDPGQSPLRIDKFLMDRVERVTRNRIQNAIRAGSILVGGRQVKPNYKVRPGEEIELILPSNSESDGRVTAEEMPLDIRYEDDDILILHKPPGLVVHPGIGHYSGTLVNGLVYYLNRSTMPLLPGNEADRPGLVHRIDKDTSGLMVIAKTEFAMSHLAKQFFEHSIERTYTALVWGDIEEDRGTIEGHIGRHPRERLRMAVFEEGDAGKSAITHFEVLERYYYVTLVRCRLETGRTHQIRVHMQHLGHPVFNDSRYGGDRIVKGTIFSKYKQFVQNCFTELPRQALHAASLGFVHPTSGEVVHFEAPIPDDMQSVLERWKRYLAGRKQNH